jgi:putative ABC transport system permease protein
MQNLFGIPMNSIMLVLLALLGIALGAVLYVVLRNRIMFFVGLRNIPRRPAQTVLIVIGLMLSTLIISAAFTTGDTVNHGLTSTSYNLLGHVDEWIQSKGEEDGPPNGIDSTIPPSTVERLRAAVQQANDPNIDGFLPALLKSVPVVDPRSRQSEPAVNFLGLDPASLAGFPDVISVRTGEQLDVASLGDDELFMNESAADALDAEAGDRVQVYAQGLPHDFTVVDIARDRLASGVGDFSSTEGMVARLDTVQRVLGRPDEVSFIAISNKGGVRQGLRTTPEVLATLKRTFARSTPGGEAVSVYDVKRDLINSSEEAGNFMTTFFVIFGLFSIASGMLLIVMIFVMLAAERKPELGMARAVGTKRRHLIEMFLSEGMAYNVLAAFVGAALGVLVAFGMARIMARLFAEYNFDIDPYVTWRSLIISYSLGVVLTFITVVFASWRVSNLNIVRAIRDIPEPKTGRMGWRWLATGTAGIVLGALLVLLGLNNDLAFPFALGFTLITFGIAIMLRYAGLRERPVFTTLCGLLLVLWALVAGGRLESMFGELNGDVEMFFLSGVAMVAAATFILVYNADLALGLVSRVGGMFGTALPAMKTAIAYPLADKFRTGMTLAMISLIIFALTMMSTMNLNFTRVFLADSARGGWDVVVDENPSNQIGDVAAALRSAGSSVPDQFRAQGKAGIAANSEVRGSATGDFERYLTWSADAGFVDGGSVPLSSRATGFESDQAVWQAFKTRDDVAIVDRFTVEGGGFSFDGEFGLRVSGIDPNAKEFAPVTITLRNPVSGQTADVQVIGVIDFGASASFFGVWLPEAAFNSVYGAPLTYRDYIGLQDPGRARDVARNIEAALLPTGVQAESLKHEIEHDQALTRNFFLLMQAFMGLGLFVGIAAVGVIAFRTVVERRQQIGMLRAIGYKRGTVALSFLLESSFVTLLAIASGVGLAIWLSFFLITSDEFPATGTTYVIPWMRIFQISALTFLASLVMTYIPSQQAARIPTAEALRYE